MRFCALIWQKLLALAGDRLPPQAAIVPAPMSVAEKIYSRLPIWGQNLAVTAYGVGWYWKRLGPGFKAHTEQFRRRESWTRDRWVDWQNEALRRLLTEAAESVPYYSDLWTADEKSAARQGRLGELPLLEKGDLRGRELESLRRTTNPKKMMVFHTSGSTGTPIATYWTVDELRAAMALREARSAGWAGVSFHQPRATFSGRMAVPETQVGGPFYRFNRIERQVYFSPFHLSATTAESYVKALHRHQIRWLTGYAVSFYLLAQLMLEQKLEPPESLRAVITTSEKVTPEMRAILERAFGAKVFEEYSTVENISFAGDCEHGRLHVSPEAGVIEILRADGSPCDPGEAGEVVATGLIRRHQPLIRFRLGDQAAWDPEPCPCGRELRVLKEVFGRIEDVIEGPDGRRMVRFHGIFVDLAHAREGQIIQETLFRIRVKIVPSPGWNEADVAEVQRRIRARLGPEVKVVVETVESIARTSAGKFRAVISEIGGETTGAAIQR